MNRGSDDIPNAFIFIIFIVQFHKKITKRSFKNFPEEILNECLCSKDWSEMAECSNVDNMAKIFSKNTKAALDEVAPIKTFIVKS